jgi:hypothetical protein
MCISIPLQHEIELLSHCFPGSLLVYLDAYYTNMNIGQILLITHLLGALYIGLFVIASIVVLVRRKVDYYKPIAGQIAFSTCFQLISGSLLTLQYQNSASLFSFCSKIGLYLFVVVIIETLLYKRLHEQNVEKFPQNLVTSSLSLGMLFVVFTLLYI